MAWRVQQHPATHTCSLWSRQDQILFPFFRDLIDVNNILATRKQVRDVDRSGCTWKIYGRQEWKIVLAVLPCHLLAKWNNWDLCSNLGWISPPAIKHLICTVALVHTRRVRRSWDRSTLNKQATPRTARLEVRWGRATQAVSPCTLLAFSHLSQLWTHFTS